MQILLEFLFEILGQFILELLVELLGVGITKTCGGRTYHSWIAIVAYAVIGALLGIISLNYFPAPFLHSPLMRLLNLLLTPLAIAAAMETLGRWQLRRGKTRTRLAIFGYAWIFAFALAAARMFMQI